MTLHREVVQEIEEKKLMKEAGKIIGIPFPFSRLRRDISEIAKGDYIGILSESGQGKSKLSRNMFVYYPLQFSAETGYNVKILYFTLEDPGKKAHKNMLCHYLHTRQNYSIGFDKLNSRGEYILPQEALDLLEKDSAFYEDLSKKLFIIENKLTPNEIAQTCEKFKEKFNDDTHVIVLIDNYANLLPEKGEDEWDAIRYFSRNIVRQKLCKAYNWTVVAVLQESAEATKDRFRSVAAGKSTAGQLEPNNSTIGDVKVIIRDFYYAIGLFNPWKYEVLRYPNSKGYDVQTLRNNFRCLNIFKNNEGDTGSRLGIFFDKHECFHQMPPVDDETALAKIYTKVLENEKLNKQKFVNLTAF